MTDESVPALPPACRLAAFDEIDSTNAEAARQAVDGAPDGLVVWARRQTGGRGRHGRSWDATDGALFLSVLCRPDVSAATAAQLSFVAGLALVQCCGALCPPMTDLRLKWPNDLLINDRKAGGVLLDAGPILDGRADWIVVGVGLNLLAAPDLPADADYAATSLAGEGGAQIEAAGAAERFARAFLTWRDAWIHDGFGAVRKAWLARAAGRDAPVRATLADETIEGVFIDIDDAGCLIVEDSRRARRTITAGDVFFPTAGG